MPPEPVPPAVPDAAPPAEPTNDLFNEPAATTPPAEAPPAETPPAETPPAETPPQDDLFGAPTETPPAETPPAETPPAETPPTETPATPPADDLFGTESAPETPAAPPAETPPAEGKTEEEPAEEEKAKTDDIFGSAVLREAGGLASTEMRQWTDNTGTFSCRGRLVRFLDGKVRLAKDNGRTTTVPLNRLSASDLEFVHRQASAQQATVFQTAQAMNTSPTSN
jgi:hypothetical protein